MTTQHSEETKGAVMAALLTGQSVSSLAREYQIPKGTVSGWKRQAFEQGVVSPATQKRQRIGELIIEYVEAALIALKAQVEAVGNERYITKQDASELAVLHGVIADKAIRILEGIAAQDESADT